MGLEALIPAGISLVGGMLGAGASRQAASQASDAATQASEQQAAQAAKAEAQAERARQDLQPWRASGEQANNKLLDMMGLSGKPYSYASEDPSYAFRLAEGQKQVDNSAAARGSTLSGGALKALQKYGQGMASQEFQNSYNRLAGMSTQGQNAAAGQGGVAMQSGSNSMRFGEQQGANTRAAGDAYGAGTLGEANAWSGALQSGVNQYQSNQLMDLYKNKGSGGGSMDWYNKR